MILILPKTIFDNYISSCFRTKILGRRLYGLTHIFLLLLIIATLSFLMISYFLSESATENIFGQKNSLLAASNNNLNIKEIFLNSFKCSKQFKSEYNESHNFNLFSNFYKYNDQNNGSESSEPLKTDARVLIIAETPYTGLSQSISILLESVRFKHRTILTGKTLPPLTHVNRGKFSIIIFEKLEGYINLDSWDRQLLDKYCEKYLVGIIAFARPEEYLNDAQIRDFPIFVKSRQKLTNYHLNSNVPLLRILKASSLEDKSFLPIHWDWTLFRSDDSRYIPIAWTNTEEEDSYTSNNFVAKNLQTENVERRTDTVKKNSSPNDINNDYAKVKENRNYQRININFTDRSDSLTDKIGKYWPVVMDTGINDGIQRVFFGFGLDFWIHKILLLDVISFMTHGKLNLPLEKYIMVDVDDIFVGKPTTRMNKMDVEAMISSQERIRQLVENFKFNLGFSGKYFYHGLNEENMGDQALIDNRHKFQWFPHSWSHVQAHTINNISFLIEDMQLNKNFAQLHDIPFNSSYSVAPHHSGVFPVHDPLYEAWVKMWGIRVTSTEEYPRLRPSRNRRGFIHKGIMVLPRQTCGLFTHTIFFNDFPGGSHRLLESVNGGELFLSIMLNRIAIFMTHLSNYGNDRLALHVFESVFKFINCWTNIKMKMVQPLLLANYYFSTYPDEQEPIWRNPCNDKRHLAIWSEIKTCKRLPNFLVIGPQKTGTTALYAYLTLHPSIKASYSNPSTFEEVQFFIGKNYRKGIDWYMEQFPIRSSKNSTEKHLLFEKSANYFSVESVPQRASALLPDASIMVIILSPAKRAYSWYQHQRAHEDPTALQYTFDEIISANASTASDKIIELKEKCLNSGFYARHIERWLRYFDMSKLLIIDGEYLRSSPIEVMDEVQDFLSVFPHINYSTLLRFNEKKGFFCSVISNENNSTKTKCLGPGKGRKYPKMSNSSQKNLKMYFRQANIALHKLLLRLERPIPNWLLLELSDSTDEEQITAVNNSTE